MRQHLVSLCIVAGCATVARSQIVEPRTTRLAFEVWNGTSWGSSAAFTPGGRVEYRVTISYTGTQSVFGLAGGRYQPTFSGIDNDGPSRDANAPFRNGGVSSNAIPGSVLSQAEGQSGAPLATYGRVGFASQPMNAASLNTLTEHRHGGSSPQADAPPGSWLRLAGSSVANWPLPTLSAAEATTTALRNITRGVVVSQLSAVNPATGTVNTFYVNGSQNLVIFRGALLLSDSVALRTITISNAEGSLLRMGGTSSADDRRYFDWHTSQFGGSQRTGVVVSDATITVIPSAGTASLALIATVALAARRRRRTGDMPSSQRVTL
ncbi:MAG TPA: hypothetical protein VK157_08535 [Phycisphaerales bacterium]|nr:hypothetical protein [Phycisphaerales bacterium]